MDGVSHLLVNNGILPTFEPVPGNKEMSARKKGVRQGLILLLSGILLVPILGVFASFTDARFMEMLVAIAAILCFIGGPLRMLYAAVFEEGAPKWPHVGVAPYMQPMHLPHAAPRSVLPPPSANPATGWGQPSRTGELVRPPSVTEGTTRLLDKKEQNNG